MVGGQAWWAVPLGADSANVHHGVVRHGLFDFVTKDHQRPPHYLCVMPADMAGCHLTPVFARIVAEACV